MTLSKFFKALPFAWGTSFRYLILALLTLKVFAVKLGVTCLLTRWIVILVGGRIGVCLACGGGSR
jgi:hypothetical protein